MRRPNLPTPHFFDDVSNVSSQILNHFSPVWAALAALSTLARYAITGPLWLAAIGLSASFAPYSGQVKGVNHLLGSMTTPTCGPPITCWNQAPTLSPGLADTTVVDVVPAAPHTIDELVTSYTGLLSEGARRPASEPWAAPLTESFWVELGSASSCNT